MIATHSAIHLVRCCHGQMSLIAVSYPVIFIHVIIIIDSKIRTEQGHQQSKQVDGEKKKVCEPMIPYFLNKYNLETTEVIGLLIEARGTIPKFS